MSQITDGVRAILSYPWVYNAFQTLMGAAQVRQYLVEQFIQPESGEKILDIGCGTAEILAYLPKDISYYGFDISEQYIAAAKKHYGTRGSFSCGLLDDNALIDLPVFDAVIVIGVLHHLDDDLAIKVFQLAKKALRSGGRIITIDGCFSPDQNVMARFLISQDRGENVRDAEGYRMLTDQAAFQKVTGTLRHQPWIPYTHWIMECVV
jgi:SAM-dependent methyltransferase